MKTDEVNAIAQVCVRRASELPTEVLKGVIEDLKRELAAREETKSGKS